MWAWGREWGERWVGVGWAGGLVGGRENFNKQRAWGHHANTCHRSHDRGSRGWLKLVCLHFVFQFSADMARDKAKDPKISILNVLFTDVPWCAMSAWFPRIETSRRRLPHHHILSLLSSCSVFMDAKPHLVVPSLRFDVDESDGREFCRDLSEMSPTFWSPLHFGRKEVLIVKVDVPSSTGQY